MNCSFSEVLRRAEKIVFKAWGVEYWLTNTNLYCSKVLQVNPGFQCSLHRHPVKDETFLLLDGTITLEQRDIRGYPIKEILVPGDTRRIAPKTLHRFANMGFLPSWILETSSFHSDADVERVEESRKI